jgi:hypothetical protein
MFLDLQFSEAKFLELLTDQVQRALPVVSDEFDDPLGSSDKLMIDHLDVTSIAVDSTPSTTVTVAAPSGATNITGKVLRLKIDIAASLTTRTKVIAAGHLGAPALQSFGSGSKADVRARADGGSLVLSVAPVDRRVVEPERPGRCQMRSGHCGIARGCRYDHRLHSRSGD